MEKDFKTNLPYKPAVLRDRNGELKKTWYVEFYVWHDASNCLVRKRVSVSMDFRDTKSRKAEGTRIVGEINKLLQKGFHFALEPIPDISESPQEKKELIKIIQSTLDTIRNTIAPKTVVTYQGAINKLKAYAGEKILYLDEFGSKESVNFRDHLINVAKNSARTANNTIQHLLSIFSKLQKRTGIEKNPFTAKHLITRPARLPGNFGLMPYLP